MYKDFFDTLFIRFRGDIEMMDMLQQTVGLAPDAFVDELREWTHKKYISLRICPDCKQRLEFGDPTIEHIVTLQCPKCGLLYHYF